jgi:hypothetical protein
MLGHFPLSKTQFQRPGRTSEPARLPSPVLGGSQTLHVPPACQSSKLPVVQNKTTRKQKTQIVTRKQKTQIVAALTRRQIKEKKIVAARRQIVKPKYAIRGAFGKVVNWDDDSKKSIKVLNNNLTDYASF